MFDKASGTGYRNLAAPEVILTHVPDRGGTSVNSLKRSPATVFIRNSDDIGKLVLRLALGAILLFRGVYKVTHGVEWIKPRLVQVGLPGLVAYGTYLAEVVSPLLLIVGYRVRLAALIIAFDMCMAIGLVLRHQILALSAQPGGGWAIELQAMILLGGVAIALLGSGRYGLDRRNG